VIVSKVHLVRVADLDTAVGTPPGCNARVELGDTAYLDISQEHRICFLTWAAKSVQIVGTAPRVLNSLEQAIAEYADGQVAS